MTYRITENGDVWDDDYPTLAAAHEAIVEWAEGSRVEWAAGGLGAQVTLEIPCCGDPYDCIDLIDVRLAIEAVPG